MNKILVSIVFTIILILGINKIADSIFFVEKPEQSAYQVANVTKASTTTASEGSSEKSEAGNIMALFASTSATDGEKVFKKCAACHSIKKEELIKLDRLCGEFLEEKQALSRIINIQKLWLLSENSGHLNK